MLASIARSNVHCMYVGFLFSPNSLLLGRFMFRARRIRGKDQESPHKSNKEYINQYTHIHVRTYYRSTCS